VLLKEEVGVGIEQVSASPTTPREIPYAVRWLVPKGERFANFDVLNDNDTQLDYYRRFGHIYAVGIPTKKWRIVVVSDPELLDEVASDEEQFGKRIEEINFFDQLRNTRGDGISVIGDGERYERIRRVMLPWYSPAHQRTQLERMKDVARKLIEAWSEMPDDDPVDARTWMERYSLEVSGRGACNYDFGLFNGGPPHAFAAALPDSTKQSIQRVAEPRPDSPLAEPRRRKQRKRYQRQNEELFRTADALVRGRAHTCPAGQQTDLLTRLLTTPDPETGEPLDLETIRDQILMHMSNGFNGPSITGAWLAYVLATNPEVEEKLLAEIDAISGGDPGYDLQYEDLMRLPYMTQVIKETLRIYPPMPITVRRSLKDGMLGSYRIRKGDIIFVGTLAAQRDPRFWGPEPDRFDPEHFAMERVVGRPRHAFIPFSIGKRQCMAQEVTFMMLRVVLFEIYNRYRLRLAPGAEVRKNTTVTTKPVSVPVVRLLREGRKQRQAAVALRRRHENGAAQVAEAPVATQAWDRPSEIPAASEHRHLVVAYGSNFGTNKRLAQRFAERSARYGYTSEVLTLNELAARPAPTQPWLLVVMASTYTSNPPTNAVTFKAWLQHAQAGDPTWRNCRYAVWGLGNSQWNAFLAFPRFVHETLAKLGATAMEDFGYADVGTPAWEQAHGDWNDRVWPALIELSGARPTQAAAERVAAEQAAAGRLRGSDSNTAMTSSLRGGDAAPRVLLVPEIMTNAVGIETFPATAAVCRELQAEASPKRTRHLEVSLPAGVSYRAGDHLGICPQNDPERVEKVAARVGAVLDGLFMVPKTMNVDAVPKGVVLQVRNVLTSLIDLAGLPTVGLVELLLSKADDPGERTRLEEIREALATPGAHSPLHESIAGGSCDVVGLLEEFGTCPLNIFEFLEVAQPLRPRYYSTSSSAKVHGDGVAHVAVGLESIGGMCSGYVHRQRAGDRLNVFLDGTDGFHLQEDVDKPMVFVSAGTGFAPMRAFLWERKALKDAGAELGEAALFNGIRSRELDYIYRDEIEHLAAEGVLDHVHVVASREDPARREHVQDRLRAEGALLWRLLDAGGYVYVCGSQAMREGVRAAFVDVVTDHGSMPREHAEAYLDELETSERRYRPDLWG
jgi:cytochrome P450/NADPH-cytochrome P450 reductase